MQNIIIRFIFPIAIFFNISQAEDINKAMDFYMQGELSLLSEDIISAENYFKEALKFSPNNPTILLSLLEIHIINKNLISIQDILGHYLSINILNNEISLEIINLYKTSNNSNELINIIDSFIENNPNSLELKYVKAQILILNEQWEELLLLYSEIYVLEEDEKLFDILLEIGITIENPDSLYHALQYIWNNNRSISDVGAVVMHQYTT